MLLTTHSRKDANTLVLKLDNATPKSMGLPERPTAQSTDQLPSPKFPNLSARLVKDVTVELTRKQKCRLIIRNLSFQAVEDNILQRFRKFGPITEVSIPRIAVSLPTKPGKSSARKGSSEVVPEKLKPRGFGFVTFLCESDAQKAVNGGCEGLKICNREFAVDFCLNRHAHEWELKRSEDTKEDENLKPENQTVEEVADEEDEDEDDEDDEEEEPSEDGSGAREDGESEAEDEDEIEDSEGDDAEESDEDKEQKTSPDASAPSKALEDVGEGRTVFVRCVVLHLYPPHCLPETSPMMPLLLISKERLVGMVKSN